MHLFISSIAKITSSIPVRDANSSDEAAHKLLRYGNMFYGKSYFSVKPETDGRNAS